MTNAKRNSEAMIKELAEKVEQQKESELVAKLKNLCGFVCYFISEISIRDPGSC